MAERQFPFDRTAIQDASWGKPASMPRSLSNDLRQRVLRDWRREQQGGDRPL
jgi:hypothetical protein